MIPPVEPDDGLFRLLGPGLSRLLSRAERIELEQFELQLGELELWFLPGERGMAGTIEAVPAIAERPSAIIEAPFIPERDEYTGRIKEVTLGATALSGGSRGRPVIIGGSRTPAFSDPDIPPPHPPLIALDVFDTRVPMPRSARSRVEDVIDDPAAWAKLNVEKYGADMVTIHLLSPDPLIKDTPPAVAARTVEEVLQAVDVPIIVGGCGDPKKDALVFREVAEIASGERLLLNSVTLDMAEAKTLEGVATAARKNGHAVLAFTGLDLNSAKELNRRLYEYLPPEDIVMDLTTVALGYGLEYSFTIHERARIAALMGDYELQHPVISASANAWSAREAWMKLDRMYGPAELRGPLWETITGLVLLLAGIDLFLMMHPAAVSTMKDLVTLLMNGGDVSFPSTDWVGTRGLT